MAVTPQPKRAVEIDTPEPEEWLRNLRRKSQHSEVEKQRASAHKSFLGAVMVHIERWPEDKDLLRASLDKLAKDHRRQEEAAKNMTEMIPNLRDVTSVPEPIVTSWVIENSDLDKNDMKKIREFDNDAPWQLWGNGTGVSLRAPLPKRLENVELFIRWSNEQKARAGGMLANVKASGRLLMTGKINYKDTSLQLGFNPSGVLIAVSHPASATDAALPAGLHITRDYKFQNFWNAQDAVAVLAPLPPIMMHTFFDKTSARPFGYASGGSTKKQKEALQATVDEAYTAWQLGIAGIASSSSSSSIVARDEIALQIASEKKAKGKTKMQAAQAKAQAAFAAKADKKESEV
jgi:hypothetical protein